MPRDIDPKMQQALEELKPLFEQLQTHVFESLANDLASDPTIRRSLNPAFPWPKYIKIGFLDKGLVIEFIGPAVADQSIIIHIEDSYETSLADFLDMDEEAFASSRRSHYGFGNINTNNYLGNSIDRLNEFTYDYSSSNEITSINGYDDIEQATEPAYWSNVTFFWTAFDDGDLRIRHIDFLLFIPINADGAYELRINFATLCNLIIALPTPDFDVQRHNDLNRFIELLHKDGVTETEITRFLTDVPELLQLAFGFHDLNAQVELKWQYPTTVPNLKPDFLPTGMDGYANILDFKLMELKSTPIVGIPQRRHPSFEVDTAIAQLEQYDRWCSQDLNQQWLEAEKGIRIDEPVRYIIMGRTKDFPASERQRLRTTRKTIIYTYDEFLDIVRHQIYRVH